MLKNPGSAIIDFSLSNLDKLGMPTHVTNELRDLNVPIPYRTTSALHAGIRTLRNKKPFSENYRNILENPSNFEKSVTISPLPVTNSNYSKEELEIIRKQSDNGTHDITPRDIKRISGRYGNKGSLRKMFTPHKVVQLSIGAANGSNGLVTDVFDFNTKGTMSSQNIITLNIFINL